MFNVVAIGFFAIMNLLNIKIVFGYNVNAIVIILLCILMLELDITQLFNEVKIA